MYIEQLYTNCLAEAAYYIESDGEAAIVDPIRETESYILIASSRGARIKYVLETHIHADFVSGHIDLAAATGAEIVFGPGAEIGYTVHEARDGEILNVGKITIKVLHTPGHTPESTCYLVRDEKGKPNAIFTGDTLFVGDVGRPDLLDSKMTKEALAAMMYDSLRNKIAPLPDDLLVYPAHGPGSACGKNIGKETWSTLGKQKQTNYALQDMTRDEFVAKLTHGLAAPPQYYFKDAAINKSGYESLSEVMSRNLNSLSLKEFLSRVEGADSGAIVLDARNPNDFESGYIPNAINIGLDDKYAWWAGTLISIETPLLIVAPIGREEEAIRRLARIGYENVIGYLEGGFDTYAKSGRKINTVNSIDPYEFAELITSGSHGAAQILDVRKPGEYADGHIEGALFIPLGSLEERIGELDPSSDDEYLIHCGGGYRSMIAASILHRHGFDNVVNVRGGFSKIKQLIPEMIVSEEAAVV
jgi:hydroxyacylglutathione hydrolase